MNANELEKSARNDSEQPPGLNPVAKALWLARAGRWDAAHDATQNLPDPAGPWIHAWLHREEGDLGNAMYWYSQAGKSAPPEGTSLKEEWLLIAQSLLG